MEITEEKIEVIRQRILDEQRKHHSIDWSRIAAKKILGVFLDWVKPIYDKVAANEEEINQFKSASYHFTENIALLRETITKLEAEKEFLKQNNDKPIESRNTAFTEWMFKENYVYYVNNNTYVHHSTSPIDYEIEGKTIDEMYQIFLKATAQQQDAKN